MDTPVGSSLPPAAAALVSGAELADQGPAMDSAAVAAAADGPPAVGAGLLGADIEAEDRCVDQSMIDPVNEMLVVVSADVVGSYVLNSGEVFRQVQEETGVQVRFGIAQEAGTMKERSLILSGGDAAARARAHLLLLNRGSPTALGVRVPPNQEALLGADAKGGVLSAVSSAPGAEGAVGELELAQAACHPVPATIAVPDAFIGLVIGKSGGTINKLMATSGALVRAASEHEVPPAPGTRRIYLRGTPEAVANAREQIERFVAEASEKEKGRQVASIRLHIPHQAVGHLMGSKGAGLHAISEATGGARVKVANEVDLRPGGCSRVVHVTGSLDGAQAAVRLVRERLQQRVPGALVGDAATGVVEGLGPGEEPARAIKVGLPAYLTGHLIGRGGESIRHIQDTSGCHIKVLSSEARHVRIRPVAGGPFRLVVCTGKQDQLLRVQELIAARLAEDPPEKPAFQERDWAGRGPRRSSQRSHQGHHGSRRGPFAAGGGGRHGAGGGGGRFHGNGGGGGGEFRRRQEGAPPGGHFRPVESPDGVVTIAMVPANCAGLVVGRAGQTVRAITQETGAQVQVEKSRGVRGSGELRQVEIGGTLAAQQLALAKICQIVSDAGGQVAVTRRSVMPTQQVAQMPWAPAEGVAMPGQLMYAPYPTADGQQLQMAFAPQFTGTGYYPAAPPFPFPTQGMETSPYAPPMAGMGVSGPMQMMQGAILPAGMMPAGSMPVHAGSMQAGVMQMGMAIGQSPATAPMPTGAMPAGAMPAGGMAMVQGGPPLPQLVPESGAMPAGGAFAGEAQLAAAPAGLGLADAPLGDIGSSAEGPME